MQIVYVLVSDPRDNYYEQFLLSVTSLRHVIPGADVILLCDTKTRETLAGKRTEYQNHVSEIIAVEAPDGMSGTEVSRWIKTSMRRLVSGDFLYIDCDTIVADDLSSIAEMNIQFGACLDKHSPLSEHSKKDRIIERDKKLGFTSYLSNRHFNSGILWCADIPEIHTIFNRWHELWLYSRSKNILIDQPSFNKAVYENITLLTELDGTWNCQIAFNGLPFLANSKIIHYFASDTYLHASPFVPGSDTVLEKIKNTGKVPGDVIKMLENPRTAFEGESRIISGEKALDVINSHIFDIILWLRIKKPRIFRFLNRLGSVNIDIFRRIFTGNRQPYTVNAENGKQKPAICIDCRMIASSGIGIYLKECLPFLLKSPNNFLLLGDTELLKDFQATSKNTAIIDYKKKPFSFWELFLFPGKLLRIINSADIYYSPYFNIPYGIKIPVYTTIHDIIFPDMPEIVSKAGLAVRMFFYRRAYKISQKIFTVSAFSKLRIQHYLGTEKPIIVAYSAISSMFLSYRGNSRTGQKKNTIVFVGNIKKHKGLDCLLDAFLLAKSEGLPHKLLIIGENEKFRTSDSEILRKIRSIGNDDVSFTGFISDKQLMNHLAEASLLVQPSLYEGFGLPPLEAMVSGTSALISDIPVFREIYGDYPVMFFSPGNANDLKDKIMEILYNKEPKAVDLPKELLHKYTFEKTASTILGELSD